MSNIHFFSEEVEYRLKHQLRIIQWIKQVISTESNKKISSINFIFCSDNYLHQMNIQYLKRNTLTDIITFNNSNNLDVIDGDIFISIDRVSENSDVYKTSMENELHRVMIHGILHLLGYSDISATEKKIMRKKENECITLLEN
jgi:probable rRNA maturation factor